MYGDAELDRLFRAWRRDIDSAPFPDIRVPLDAYFPPIPTQRTVRTHTGESPGGQVGARWLPPPLEV